MKNETRTENTLNDREERKRVSMHRLLLQSGGFGISYSVNRMEYHLFPPHSHAGYELIYILSADGAYHIEDRSYQLNRHDLILTRPGRIHYLEIFGNVEYERYNILCDASRIPTALMDEIPKNVDVVSFADDELAYKLFSELQSCKGHVDEELFGTLSESALYMILLGFATRAKRRDRVEFKTVNPLLEKALDYIKKNFDTISSIDEICREIYITKSHLHHLFMENLHITPKKYILEKRLIKARRAIRGGARPSSVYRDSGFVDYASFFRNYKARFGYPPSEEGEHNEEIMPILDDGK